MGATQIGSLTVTGIPGSGKSTIARALVPSRADGDEQGVATSLGSLAMIDVAEGEFESAEANFDAAIEAYERAGMEQAADGLRAMREALVVNRVPIGEVVHRQTAREWRNGRATRSNASHHLRPTGRGEDGGRA